MLDQIELELDIPKGKVSNFNFLVTYFINGLL